MRDLTCDVAIIGAGTAGLNACKAATAAGADVLLIERGPGGSTCTRVGCMPSKLLIAAGRAAHRARGAARFGIKVDAVAVDGVAVLARVRRERDFFVQSVLDQYHAIPEERRIHGEARFLGPDRLQVGDDTCITAKSIIVAAGAHPIVPKSLEAVKAHVRTHETIFEIEALPDSMAVLGAGPLGLELAQAFARLGVAVTVFDEAETLGKLGDPEAGAAAKAALGREIDLKLGVKVEAKIGEGGRPELTWTGAERGSRQVDLILAATGRPPNLDPLNLAAAGLPLDEDGVPCFDKTTHRCGDSNIFIAGDVDAWRPVLHEAARGGRIAGTVAAGGSAPRVLPAFSIAFTEPNLVEVGTRFDSLPEGARVSTIKVADDARSHIDGADEGVVRLYADDAGMLTGATIVADGGEHLGHLVALGIDRGITAADFADQPWYHPTIEEMLQEGARGLRDGDGPGPD